jgi:glyoxylase-like metal-dependent hydrolase (beta-lactamase superfamily II)
MKIIPLSEGSFTIDQTKLFVPFDESTDSLKDRTSGSLLVEIQPFLVITSRDVLLLDTGLGFEKNGMLQLVGNLAAAGIQSTDVTKVLLSHLHKDHAGGVGVERDGLGGRLSLPNADYYVQRAELSFAFEKGAPSFVTSELECLRNESRVHLLDGSGVIDDYIEYSISGAHSPFHQVFFIKEDGQTIFYGGDEAPQLHQMKHRFVAKYDHDGKKAMELRQQWWTKGEAQKWTFLFYHDLKNPVWKFE